MKQLLLTPFTRWLIWYRKTRKLISKNREKSLKIGYLSTLINSSFGKYNTFYERAYVTDSSFDDYVYVAQDTHISNASIGKYCSIGPFVKIGLGMHPTHLISTFPAFFSTKRQCQISYASKEYFEETGRIIIGNDVWIGANVIVLDNVEIGDGAIIGAGSVVTKNVEPYSIIGGVPGKLIRKRFDQSTIDKLVEFKWWEKDPAWIESNYKLFNMPEEFINQYLT